MNSQGLLMGDYAQIEARALVTWAGQTNMIDAFRTGKDPYRMMAADTYNKPQEQINDDERFMGKQQVLSAGYQVGADGFAYMLKLTYDVHVTRLESERLVQSYRKANPKVVKLWYAVQRLAERVLVEQSQNFIAATDVPLIAMRMIGKWMVMRLPSARCLWYYEPELMPGVMVYFKTNMLTGARERYEKPVLRIVYWGRDINRGGAWGRVDTYGGKLVENGTQAMARDVMGEGMIRLEDDGFDPRFTVHDDVIAPGHPDQLERFKSLLKQNPKWWPELPLDVDAKHRMRYQK